MTPRWRRALSLAAALAAAAGIVQLTVHFNLFALRLRWGLDLEWMEGGTLVHALRLMQGQSIYPPPSVDFVPFLYTPLYPALLAALAKVFGLGYALGRAVSVASFAFACAAIVVLAARQAPPGDRAAGLRAAAAGVAGAGALCASFRFTGGFYDLVRGDSMMLALEFGALWLAYDRRSLASAAACGVLIVLGFLTKQTASIIGIGIGVGLLVASWRRGVAYGATAAVLLAASIGLLVKLTDGWFWTYIFKLHQGHTLRWDTVFKTPRLIARHGVLAFVALGLSVALLARARRIERRDAILLCAAVAGFVAAWVGYGTQWAFENAFIPGVAFPLVAAAILIARLAAGSVDRPQVMLSAACLLLLAGQALRPGLPSRAALSPSERDREAGKRMIDTIRALPGPVYIGFHPYYAVLAGKQPFVHRMGVMDVMRTPLGRPAGFDDAFARQRWAFVILDWKYVSGEWPMLTYRYHPYRPLRYGIESVRSFSGAETWPNWVWAATREPPERPAHTVIADFESNRWLDWKPEGDAFGRSPAPARPGLYGRYAADSGRNSPVAVGKLRSPPIRIDKKFLAFTLTGNAGDPGLRVVLASGTDVVRAASVAGDASVVEWDVSALRRREVTLVVEDSSQTGSLGVDQVVAY